MSKKYFIFRFSRVFLKKRYWFFIILFLIPIWIFFIAPFLLRIPSDFWYRADMISVDNFYDENIGDFRGEQYSNTQFSYEVVNTNWPILTIKNIFHVTTGEGRTIFKAEPLYAINSFTWKHVRYYGDKVREGYLFAPRGLNKNETFLYWHVTNNKSSTMRYAGERLLYWLRVFKYESEYQWAINQTEFMGHLPGVPEERGVKLGNRISMWVEPLSGYVVKMEEKSEEYFYFDIRTGQKIAPYNQFLNVYTEQSVRDHVKSALGARNKAIAIQIVVPVLLFLSLIISLIFYRSPTLFIFFPEYLIPWFVLGWGFLITFFAYSISQRNIQEYERNNFSYQAEEITSLIRDKMDIYINALSGGKWFFDASESVERDEWRSYVNSLNIQQNYPGIQGIGFSQVIQSEEKENFVTSVRNEWFPDFRITPEGERDIYTSIVFLEPFDQRNKRAFGYDMFSESTRREAMIRARDTWLPALSEKVILKQETDVDIQNGFLLYVPVYNNATPTDIPKNSIFWYVYAPFRINDFISPIFNTSEYSISFRIFDGLRTVSEIQLYSSPSFPSEDKDIIYRDIKTISIAGRPWTIEFVNSPTFQRSTIYIRFAYGILILGFLVSILLFFVIHSLMISRKKAVDYAQKVNRKLIKNIQELELTRDATIQALHDVEIQKNKFQRTNTRLKLATHSAKIGVWEWDIVKDNLIWDSQMYELYGYKKEDFSGKAYDAWYASIHPDDKEMVNKALQHSLRTNQVFDTKFRIVCPDNSLRDIRAFGLVETDDKHKPVHMVWVNWDITHEALVDRQKTEFVSIASHQLRTPLTSIGWYTEMMLHGDTGKTSPAQKKYLNEIYKSHTAMVDLVNKLLSVSRIDLGTLMVDSKVTNMNDIVRDIISENKKKISLNKILIREHIGQVGECLSDPTLVRIIFQNLIANAIKYTPQGGKIDISLSLKWKNILFKITDNGRGIPEEQQKDIFHKFFRANNTKDVNGTGLGLYIVRSIAEKLWGKVWFESGTRGTKKGTTFSVQLPFIPNKQNPIKKSS